MFLPAFLHTTRILRVGIFHIHLMARRTPHARNCCSPGLGYIRQKSNEFASWCAGQSPSMQLSPLFETLPLYRTRGFTEPFSLETQSGTGGGSRYSAHKSFLFPSAMIKCLHNCRGRKLNVIKKTALSAYLLLLKFPSNTLLPLAR